MGKWGFLLILPIYIIGCTTSLDKGNRGGDESLSWQITFFSLGANVQFADQTQIKKVSVYNSDENRVAELNFPTAPRQTETLYFEWQEGATYRFEATHSTGQVSHHTATVPLTFPHGSLEIAIPYGAVGVNSDSRLNTQNLPNQDQKALILQGSPMTATVIITNGKAPSTFDLEICLPSTLFVVRLPEGWRTETVGTKTCLTTAGTFSVASEVWYRELVLKASEQTTETHHISDTHDLTGVVRFSVTDRVGVNSDSRKVGVNSDSRNGEISEQNATVQIQIADSPEIVKRLSIKAIEMPANAIGKADPRQRKDTIYYLRPLFGWFGKEQTDFYEPITYQTVQLYNEGEETIHVVVTSINRDVKSGQPVPFLAPPDAVNAGTDRSISFASLPGGKRTTIPLPIYFQPQSAEVGRYEREIAVKLWGSDTTVLKEKRPLHVIVPNQHTLFVSGIAVVASCIGLIMLLRFHRQFFVRFTTKQLIVIALFGTTIFVAIVVPSTLFLNLVRALFGPFSVLATGLLNETLYYALLTALLIYIYGNPGNSGQNSHDALPLPVGSISESRPNTEKRNYGKGGVILLVSAVRLLLGAVTFGLFTPMTIIFTATTILLLETGFLIVRKRGLLAWAIALGICDAIAVYVDFQLSILFYRLFFADWYILLRIVVEGFVYTFIGVLLGAKLGRGLWRVAD